MKNVNYLSLPNHSHTTPFEPAPPLMSSRGRGWNGVTVEEGRQGAHHWHVPASPEHRIFLVLKQGTGRVRRQSGEETFDGVPDEGTLSIVPAGQGGACRCEGCVEALHIRLAPDFVARVAQENFGTPRFHLATRLGVRDEPMRQIALLLRAELHAQHQNPDEPQSAGNSLLTESLAHALTVYLLRFHAHFHISNSGPVCEICGGLSDRALGRVTELVQQRLATNLSLDDMASAAGISRFHFARSFKRSTGLTPHQFVIAQRVERAKQLLLEGRLPLREVAEATGFADQSHLTRQFRHFTGTTPRGFKLSASDKSEQESSKNTR